MNHHQKHPSNFSTDRDWKKEFHPEWIKQGIDKQCVNYTRDFGEYLSDKRNGITTSQIRNVYGELKRIQMKGFNEEYTSFLLLSPKMAYATKRGGTVGLKEFKQVFDKAFDGIESASEFENFMNFMEAVLAYHKASGGK